MKKTTFAALVICFALASCLPASTLTPTHLTPDTSRPSTTLRASLTPSPTPAPATETPAPTETPTAVTYSIAQLEAMTSDEKLALAPEAPEGAVKSLYREAPNLVFYQDSDLTVTGAYDLTTGKTYTTAETIPLPAIQRTVGKDILDKYSFENTVANIPKIKDTVLDGEEPFYRLRALQAYRDGQIPNFSETAVLPNLISFALSSGITPLKTNARDPIMADLEKRPYRDVTLVQDGEGGVRIVQIFKQQDGTVDVVWGHLTKKAIQNKGGLIGSSFDEILKAMFDNPRLMAFQIVDYESKEKCFDHLRDETFCADFMAEDVRTKRLQAVNDWTATIMIPPAIKNGEIQFPMLDAGW